MKNRKHVWFFLIMIMGVLFAASGCIQYDQPTPAPEQEHGEENAVVDPKPVGEEKEVTLYFMDKQIVETGQGDYQDLVTETRKITVDDQHVAQVVLEELQAGPQSENGVTMFRKDIQIISVEVADKIAYVNLSSQNLFGGSLEEMGIFLQVGTSLTQLDHIDQVQFLVDGTKRETLMGHVEISEPWSP